MSSGATVTRTGPASPTRAVLSEIAHGAATLAEIARRTGLDPQLVDTAIVRLVAAGYLDSEAMRLGCPPDGCRACSSASGNGACTAPSTGAGRTDGPVLIGLTVRPRDG